MGMLPPSGWQDPDHIPSWAEAAVCHALDSPITRTCMQATPASVFKPLNHSTEAEGLSSAGY